MKKKKRENRPMKRGKKIYEMNITSSVHHVKATVHEFPFPAGGVAPPKKERKTAATSDLETVRNNAVAPTRKHKKLPHRCLGGGGARGL